MRPTPYEMECWDPNDRDEPAEGGDNSDVEMWLREVEARAEVPRD